MNDLLRAVEVGRICRRKAREYGASFLNPFPFGSQRWEAWRIGYENDTGGFLDMFGESAA